MRILQPPANNAILLFINVLTVEWKDKKKEKETRQPLVAGHFLLIFELYKKDMILSDSDKMAVLDTNAETFRQCTYVSCLNTKFDGAEEEIILYLTEHSEVTYASIWCYAFFTILSQRSLFFLQKKNRNKIK